VSQYDLDRLSFPELLERIAKGTWSPRGERLLRSTSPLGDLTAVHDQQQVIAEINRAIEGQPRIPFNLVPDVEGQLARLQQRGAVLDGLELLDLATTVRALDELGEWTSSQGSGQLPTFERLHGFPGRYSSERERLDRAIDRDGSVRDDATDLLTRLRKRLINLQNKVRQNAQEITERLYREGLAQEPEPALREGRYVVSVRAESQGSVAGVVIDRSRSGQSVFIEPREVSEVTLELKEVSRDEVRETERILTELSAMLADRNVEIDLDLDRLAHLDAAQAAARYSEAGPFMLPTVSEEGDLVLKEARHPLLAAAHGAAKVIPLSLSLTEGSRTLVISGPNSGGKTVALQTIGLCAALALCGLPIPASGESRLPWLQRMHVDIGDEQSIEDDLSTFTARLRRIREMLESGPGPRLNLIDEAGAGTDPAQGAALAIAIIEELTSSRSWVVCITHDGRIKAHAAQADGMANGRMVFSSEALTPTYEYRHGEPGRSFAFEIAERSGIPTPIVHRARELLGPAGDNLERALKEAEASRERLAELETRAAAATRMAEKARREHEQLARELADNEKSERKRAAERAADIISDARRTVERVVREIRESEASAEVIRSAHDSIERATEQVVALQADSDTETMLEEGDSTVVEGMTVYLKGLERPAQVLNVDGGRVRVMAGSISLDVALADVEPAPDQPATQQQVVVQAPSKTAALTLDIIGQRAEEARNTLEKYLDDALLSGLTRVRIIHGSGAGVLRRVVDEVLGDHDQVSEHGLEMDSPGGTGVTWVELEGAPA